jgi:hypothetical protein
MSIPPHLTSSYFRQVDITDFGRLKEYDVE